MTGKRIGVAFVFSWFVLGGIAHFARTDAFMTIMPPYVPHPREMIWLTGVLELVGAACLWVKSLRQWAGYGLILLVIRVTPSNVYMWQHPELFPRIPEGLLGLRLLVQLLLILCIWWCTRPESTVRSVRTA